MYAYGTATMFLKKAEGQTVAISAYIRTASSWVETKPLDFGKDNLVKYIEKILYNVRGRSESPSLRLEVRGSDDEEGPFELLDTIYIGLEDPGYTDPDGKRFYKLKLIDPAVQKRWALHGLTIFGEPGGEEF